VLRLLVLVVGVGVFNEHRCIADGVEVTRQVISAMRELFREGEGIEF
jgi:hypothetical protein